MEDLARKRTHKLIGLGGLFVIARLDFIDRPLLMGLLNSLRNKYYLMNENEKKECFKQGLSILQERRLKKSNRRVPNEQSKS